MRRLDPKQRTAAQMVGVIVVMGALAWAAVPLYDLFCRVTGYGGTTGTASAGQGPEVLDRTIKVRFDASKERDFPWEIKPVERTMEVRLGETGMTFYEAHNPTDERMVSTASYNVAPFGAGGYFIKVDCFCFTRQVLEPGETVEMPVTFYVDPEILDDREMADIPHITLSYTFHHAEKQQEQASVLTDTESTLQ